MADTHPTKVVSLLELVADGAGSGDSAMSVQTKPLSEITQQVLTVLMKEMGW